MVTVAFPPRLVAMATTPLLSLFHLASPSVRLLRPPERTRARVPFPPSVPPIPSRAHTLVPSHPPFFWLTLARLPVLPSVGVFSSRASTRPKLFSSASLAFAHIPSVPSSDEEEGAQRAREERAPRTGRKEGRKEAHARDATASSTTVEREGAKRREAKHGNVSRRIVRLVIDGK